MQAKILYISGRRARQDDLLRVLEALREFGIEAKVMEDLSEMWSEAAGEEFDLALIDIDELSFGGYDPFVNVNDIISEIPSLLLSESGTLERWIRALESGAVGFLTRPFDTEELTRSILRLISRNVKK